MKALHVMVHGRVQGVWFRGNTQQQAQHLGLNGWVRNTADGAVEIHVQGEEMAVDRLLAWCYTGPPGARVSQVDAEPVAPLDKVTGFSIRY